MLLKIVFSNKLKKIENLKNENPISLKRDIDLYF